MKLNKENSYLFYDIDRHGTIHNQASGMLVNEFTMMIRFKPDLTDIIDVLEKRKNHPSFKDCVYHKQCIIGKNGKHQGLFFTSLIDSLGKIVHCIEYEWWQNPLWEKNKNSDDDVVQAIKFYVNPENDEYYDVVVIKDNEKVTLDVNGEKQELPYDCIIDYSMALMWLGAANRLLDDTDEFDEGFACVYTGDIHLLHVQESPLTDEQIKLFFDKFEEFIELKFNPKDNVIYISTNFSETTPYKVRDYSGNGLHPLLFNREWIG